MGAFTKKELNSSLKFKQTIKLGVFYESTEIKQKASKIGIVFVKI